MEHHLGNSLFLSISGQFSLAALANCCFLPAGTSHEITLFEPEHTLNPLKHLNIPISHHQSMGKFLNIPTSFFPGVN